MDPLPPHKCAITAVHQRRADPPYRADLRSPCMPTPRYEATVLKQILLLISLLFIVYSNTFDNSFVWDDIPLIETNPRVHSLRYIPTYFTVPFFGQPAGLSEGMQYPYWRPLTLLSLSLDYAAWGRNTFGYHLTNLFLHALNAVLVLLIFRLVPGAQRVAFICALVFALHPLQTNAVSYLSGRTDLLATAFLLAASLFCLRHLSAPRGSGASIAGIALCLVLSLMAKETALTAPLLFFLLGGIAGRPFARRNTEAVLASIAVLIAYVACREILRLSMGGWVSALGAVSAGGLAAVTESLVLYARLFILPIGLHMERFLAIPPLHDPAALFSICAVILAMLWAARSIARGTRAGYLFFWSCAALLPVSNIIPLYPAIAARQIFIGEQFLYLPSVGISAIMAFFWLAADSRSEGWHVLARAAAAGVLLLFGILTYAHNEYWKDEVTFYSSTAKYYSGSVRMCTNLAILYAREGQFDESLRLLHTMADQNPLSDLTHCRLAAVHYKMGKLDLAREELTRALTLNPHSAAALDGLGLIDRAGGRIDSAIAYYTRAIAASPLYLPPRLNLAAAYMDQGKAESALRALHDAVSTDPDSIEARTRLASLYEKQGRPEEAAAQYRILFARHPECETALRAHRRGQR